jgi:hypothetical protein
MPDSRISLFWNGSSVLNEYETGVSLHSHTSHSKEPLDFLTRFRGRFPIVQTLLQHQGERLKGALARMERGYWTPPLNPRAALVLEREQIERMLGLRPLVSLTDHDTIDGVLPLRLMRDCESAPVSVEWSAPTGPTVLHIGIHNLPSQSASNIMRELAGLTAQPSERRIGEMLAWLQELPEVLLVLNHPLWDELAIGRKEHHDAVDLFLNRNRRFIHALELNGLRPWSENSEVVEFADCWRLPVISGGDRHGREPNANVNLTRARTFAEFVSEVRNDSHSHVLFLPQYREPYALRVTQTVLDVLREYDEYPEGAKCWDNRVYCPDSEGIARPLSYYWPQRSPWLVKRFAGLVRIMHNERLQRALRFALQEGPASP